MEEKEKMYKSIAAECQNFEHVIAAMGYGYSLLNVAEDNWVRRCPDCVHWQGGDCPILQRELMA